MSRETTLKFTLRRLACTERFAVSKKRRQVLLREMEKGREYETNRFESQDDPAQETHVVIGHPHQPSWKEVERSDKSNPRKVGHAEVECPLGGLGQNSKEDGEEKPAGQSESDSAKSQADKGSFPIDGRSSSACFCYGMNCQFVPPKSKLLPPISQTAPS